MPVQAAAAGPFVIHKAASVSEFAQAARSQYLALNDAAEGIRITQSVFDRLEVHRPVTAIRTLKTTITAYSSVPWETDSTPHQTASGACVRDGIVAANFLAFGTKLRIPGLFGNKIFEVQDRMNTRYPKRVDVWMLHSHENRLFGIKRNVTIEIIELGDGQKYWGEGLTNRECQEIAST